MREKKRKSLEMSKNRRNTAQNHDILSNRDYEVLLKLQLVSRLYNSIPVIFFTIFAEFLRFFYFLELQSKLRMYRHRLSEPICEVTQWFIRKVS